MDAVAAADLEQPPDLKFSSTVFDIAFHPSHNVIAVGLISGKLDLFTYGPGECNRVVKLQLHKNGLRSLAFTADGEHLFSGSSDQSIKCINTEGSIVWATESAHTAPVNVVKVFSENLLASGDDDGVVKLWDTRTPGSEALTFSKHKDVIQDFLIDETRGTLLSASGDGTIGVVDLRKGKFVARTEEDEDEYLSLACVKGGSKVVAGTQRGVLEVWDWGKWKPKDGEDYGPERFTGHPESVDAMLVVDEDTILTGSSDGLIRILTIQPNKLVGIVGEHGEFPIECLAWSHDRRYLGSASHDNMVKFWDVAYLFEDDGEGGEGSKFTALPGLEMQAEDDDFAADSDDDEDGTAAAGAGAVDSDDDDDDDDSDDDDDDDGDDDDDSDGDDDDEPAAGAGFKKNGAAAKKAPASRSFYEDL